MPAVEMRRGWGWLLFAALTVSTIGDEISLLTLMFRTAGDRTAYAIPMLLIAQLLPGLLATPLVGRLVDRRDAGKLLLLSATVEAMIITWMAFHPDFASTLAGAGLLSIAFAISGTASFALIPVLAARLGMSLPRANAMLEVVRSAGMLAGPITGGALVAWGGTRNALLIDAATFALLAAMVFGSGLRRPMTAPDNDVRTLFSDYLPILRDRRIAVLVGALTLEVYATAIADVAFVFLITMSFAAGPAAFGLLTACWAGGMMAGAALSGSRAMPQPGPIAFAAATTMGLSMLIIGVAAAMIPEVGLIVTGAAFIVGGLANSTHNVAVRTLLQRDLPAGVHGKIAAVYSGATSTAAILGYVTGGLFTPYRAVDAYVFGGTLGLLAGVGGWLLFARSRAKAA